MLISSSKALTTALPAAANADNEIKKSFSSITKDERDTLSYLKKVDLGVGLGIQQYRG